MTLATFHFGKFTLEKVDIVIGVARNTGVFGAEVANAVLANRFVAPGFGVTVLAFDLGVGTVQDETGELVVEFFLIDIGGVEGSAFMIGMTINTGAALHPTVKADACFDLFTNFRMATKAIGIRDTAAWFMAFQAVFVFQVFMSLD